MKRGSIIYTGRNIAAAYSARRKNDEVENEKIFIDFILLIDLF